MAASAPSTSMPRWSAWLLYGALPLAAFIASAWLHRRVFFCAPITTDENSYIFQAYNFLAGLIARPCPPWPDMFFHEMIICDERVGWLSRYPPGHALWLLPGCWLQQPHLMVSLAAALSVGLMARLGALFGTREAWLAAGLLLLSPFFLFIYGTLLSHTSGLLAVLLLLYGFVRWQMSGQWRYAVLAGAGWSWLYLNRTYTAALLVPPLALYSLLTLFRRRREKTAWWGVLCFAGTAASGLALIFLYNYLALGDGRVMTYLYHRPTETLGFGVKEIGPALIHHTLSEGLRHLGRNLRLYNEWLFGFPGSLAVAAAGALIGWRKAWSPLLLLSPVLVWAGYMGFFAPGLHEVGPAYYAETLPFVVLAAALGFGRLLGGLRARGQGWLFVLLALVGGWLVSEARFVRRQAAALEPLCRPLTELRAIVQQAPSNAVVVATAATPFTSLRYSPLIFNPHGLNSQPLIVRSQGAADAYLLPKLFPGRELLVLVSEGGAHRLAPLTPAVCQMALPLDALHHRTGQRLGGGERQPWTLRARPAQDAPGYLAFGCAVLLPPGRYVARFDVDVRQAPAGAKVWSADVVCNSGREVLARGEATAANAGPLTLAFDVTRITTVEPRVFYEGQGEVTLRGIAVLERQP